MQKPKKSNIQVLRYKTYKHISQAALILTLISLIAIIVFILVSGVPHLSGQLLFGKYSTKNPSILPALAGTFYLILISLSIAAPLGILSAVFLVEYTNNKSKIVKCIKIATETLAGIPSIVYGLFGYLIFVVALKMGYSLLGGGLTLAVMVLPVIVRATEESLLAVPKTYREGAYALGTNKVRTIFRVILPSASGGIVTALILAVGRVISESAVLILTIGMVVNKMPATLLSSGTSLALDVYYFGSHGYPEQAAATGVVLLLLVITINLTATLVGKLLKKGKGDSV